MTKLNAGLRTPPPWCDSQCGQLMQSFDQLPRSLRDFFNDEALFEWCMCGALQKYQRLGEAETLRWYRERERRYRNER